MKEKSRDSLFVRLPGLLFLLFLTVVSVYFRAGLIAGFLCMVSLVCLLSRFWSRAVLSRVQVSVEVLQDACHAGESLRLKLGVRNRSFLPLVWLDVILLTGKKRILRAEDAEDFAWFLLNGESQAQTGIRSRFVWLLWQQEILWEETLRSVRRGVVELQEVGLQAGDGFGLSAMEKRQKLPVPQHLVVYPWVVPVAVQPFLKITQEAVAESRGQAEDITILKSSRVYQPGDPMKRINWRLLAGSGRMEVNVYETVLPGCAAFLLDLFSFRYMAEQDNGAGNKTLVPRLRETELESMISLVASCMQAVSEQGLRTALLIPSYGTQEAVLCIPENGENMLAAGMEALAMVQYETQETHFPYEEFWRISHKLGNLYICALSEEASSFGELADHMGRSRARYLVLKRGESEGMFDCLYGEDLALERLDGGRKGAVS